MTPQFTVRVADLEDGPRTIAWDLAASWLETALVDAGASPRANGNAEVTLTLSGRDVLVTGHVTAALTMPCVVSLDPVPVDVEAEVQLLLVPSVHSSRRSPRRGGPADDAQPPRAVRGRVRAARSNERSTESAKGWASDPTLSDDDASLDTYDGEMVVLDSFFREAILLDLPMAPRRSDLPKDPVAATAHRSAESGAASGPPVDPRLMPLAAIASRLRKNKE